MKKVSVIVPVYNTGKYLKKCIDSILSQSYENIEIIIVNDGSTDNSEEIIKEYLSDKIIYLKKENGGLSDAKNFGVKYANGDYISFIDSDDYIDKNLFQNLSEYMESNIELIKFKMKIVDENYNVKLLATGPVFGTVKGEDGFNTLYTKDNFIEPSPLYLYNKDFFVKNNFQFGKGMYHEDFGLTPIIILMANTMASTNIYGYYYMQTEDSITRNIDYSKQVKRAEDLLAHYDNMLQAVSNMDIADISRENIKEYYANSIILKCNDLKENDLKQYIQNIKKRKLIRNIKINNIQSLVKKVLLCVNIRFYLKLKIVGVSRKKKIMR